MAAGAPISSRTIPSTPRHSFVLGGGDVLDGEDYAGIEDQFIAQWSCYLAGIGSFAPPAPASELARHLRSILREEALKGPCSPGPFLDRAQDAALLELAAELWNERQALILKTR
jgi:hypothetical protein